MKQLDIQESLVLACGLSYGFTVLSALVLLYLAGQLGRAGIAGLLSAVVLFPGIVYGWKLKQDLSSPPHPAASLNWVDMFYFAIPLAVAAFFSIANLGYADYWGDEMNGLLRAIAIIAGQSESIFEHTKGPVEVLVPAVFGLLVEQFTPFLLRLPFACAYTAGVAAFYVLARRMFNRNVALLAGLLLAINGLHLAFGRIVQYQSIVLLATNLSILLAYLFYSSGKSSFLWLSAFLAALGLLAHYDMLLTLPVIAYLGGSRYRQDRSLLKKEWPQWAVAAAIFLLILLLFYAPFWLHPQASETSSYLARRISLDNLISNNFDELYRFSVANSSSYYGLFVMVFSLGCMAADLYSVRLRAKNSRLWAVIATAVGLAGVLTLAGQFYLIPITVFTLLFLLLVVYSGASFELKVIYVWLAVSFIGYMFLVDNPRSHLRIIYPAVLILAALGMIRLFGVLARRISDRQRHKAIMAAAGGLIFGLCFALFAGYEYLLFVDTQREYIFTYPQHKSELYWEDPDFPFGSRRPYGAPHRLGWQQINNLYLQGYFEGDWNSNDEGSNLFWYTLGAPQNPCYPRYYFLTRFEQKLDSEKELPPLPERSYVKIGEVWNRDRLQMEVFKFAPLGYSEEMQIWTEPEHYPSFVTPADFNRNPYEDTLVTPQQIKHSLSPQPIFKPHSEMLKQVAEQYRDPRINNVRDKVTLLGYDLDETWSQPGGAIKLTLYWQAIDVVNLPYKISVQLESQGEPPQVWSQADDFPACGTQLSYHWPVGNIIADTHLLQLPEEIPSGDYILRIGLYEPKTGLRLDLLDEMGNPAGITLLLTNISLPDSKLSK